MSKDQRRIRREKSRKKDTLRTKAGYAKAAAPMDYRIAIYKRMNREDFERQMLDLSYDEMQDVLLAMSHEED